MPRARIGVLALLALLAASCGKSGSKGTTVQGKVFYRGSAVAGGTIVFTPDPAMGGSGELAAAEIGTDGSYTIEAPPGWHRVTVKGPPSFPVPGRYAVFELSGLNREVKRDAPNVHDIRLD